MSMSSVWSRDARRIQPGGGDDDLRDAERDVQEFIRTVTAAPDPASFHAAVVSQFLRLTAGESACYCQPSSTDGVVVPKFCSEQASLPEGSAWRNEGGLIKWLRANEQPLVFPQRPEVLAYLDEAERRPLEAAGISVCVPLLTNHRLVGVVLVAGTVPWQLHRGLVDLLRRCAEHAAVLSDVVEQRHADRLRLEASARAQQLALAGQLAAAVAHEVRNPLATIRSSVQYVSDSSADWTSKNEILQHVVGEVDRINRTLSAMLGLSRPESLDVSDVDLSALVRQVLVLIQPYVDHQHLLLDDSGVGAPVVVRADRRQLQQVVLNVLINACQAMERGGRLSIVVLAEAGRAAIRISDTGAGIAPADLSRIFETFYTTKANGTGLGLPICREIVMRHGGEIDVESEVGVGTSVTVALPRLPA